MFLIFEIGMRNKYGGRMRGRAAMGSQRRQLQPKLSLAFAPFAPSSKNIIIIIEATTAARPRSATKIRGDFVQRDFCTRIHGQVELP